ncbi:MAG: GNAT family N-acetyltransferase [Planctomycetes bacterium]|nr:GNAT family N-acetyltransferase [Planctomycetota bacterium]
MSDRRPDAVEIGEAGPEDLAAIHRLQRLAYRSEAALLGDFTIPPLRERLEEIQRQFAAGTVFLAARAGSEVIGSVRGRAAEGTFHIGKLMVHPDWQGAGIGRRLLAALENRSPCRRLELFTSDKSGRNLSLYERAGYVRFREEAAGPGWRLVFLEKTRS